MNQSAPLHSVRKTGSDDSACALDRRTWIKGAAALVGGTTAAGLLTPRAFGATASAPAGDISISAAAAKAVIETKSGKVRGFVRNGIYAFKGMPYAASTAGKNRFMAPAAVEPWAGVRSALALGFCSPQAMNSTFEGRRAGWKNDEEAFMFEWDDGQPSEDCLLVNVWTPAINDNRRRPVLVWIHGGGFTGGSCNELKAYDGENLARRGDAVVVSLNHRLGVLGYLNLLEYGGKWADAANAGMLDLVAALGWVRDNIANFGGDPASVMIFGQSGGGSKVGNLMGMPAAKELFHRAAIQSGSSLRTNTPDRSAELTAATLAELGLTKASLDRIQELPYEQIVRAGLLGQRKVQPVAAAPGTGGGINWSPTVDGRVIPGQPWDPAAPAFAATVPLLVGTVLNEFTNSIQAGDPSLDTMPMDEMKRRVTATRGDKTNAIIATFRRLHPQATPYELLSRINGAGMRQNAITQAERKAAQGTAPAYAYWFTRQSPLLEGRPRAFHCSELPFVFNNTDRCAANTGGGAAARALGEKMSDAWVGFARTGNPNHRGLPKWDPFKADSCPTMIFDETCVAKNNPDTEERKSLQA